MSIELKAIFERLAAGHDLTQTQARDCFERIMAGDLSDVVIGALLGAMLTKGESVDELVGAAEAMRASMTRITCKPGCIDTCSTGGDGVSTFNVSTTAAIIAASAGATVAKHGNRSTTRASGSTEVLQELGIDVEADRETVERCIAQAGIGYLNARKLHPAMKHAAAARAAIPTRTLFNLLGPLTNPAGARRQVIGVPKPDLVDKLAGALSRLGTDHAWIVHGAGLADLTVTGPTHVVEVIHGSFRRFDVSPESVGLRSASIESLQVASPRESARVVRAVLGGEPGPPRDHALMNAAAAVVVAGIAPTLADGVTVAAGAIDDGKAAETLNRWRSIAGRVGNSDHEDGAA